MSRSIFGLLSACTIFVFTAAQAKAEEALQLEIVKGEISCYSGGHAYATCSAQDSAYYIVNVDLVKQISQADCVKSHTFGVVSGKIWVDKGCRGSFTFRAYTSESARNIDLYLQRNLDELKAAFDKSLSERIDLLEDADHRIQSSVDNVRGEILARLDVLPAVLFADSAALALIKQIVADELKKAGAEAQPQ